MNTEELMQRWSNVIAKILEYEGIDPSQLNAFFSRLQPQAMSDGFIMLTADNDFIKSWVESHYSQHIKQALQDVYGIPYTVAIEINANQAPVPINIEQPALRKEPEPVPVSTAAETVEPGTREKPVVSKEEPPQPAEEDEDNDVLAPTSSLTFENFVIGESNRMAYSMALSVAEEPGSSMLNPLFIYGKSGLGKTHLMRAIQNYVKETQPELKTVYVDSADFLAGYVEATLSHDTEKSSFKNFKQHYQEANILLIDDIQFLQGKEQTLDIVFQIFKTLIDEGKQVVLSADRAPKNITMDERYRSRFNSGGTVDIQPPAIETKMGIIQLFLKEYRTTSGQPDFRLPESVIRYIAENSGSNIRELKSAVTKVIYAMNTPGSGEITEESVAVLLENHFSGGNTKKLTIPDVQKQVELYFGIPHADLVGQKRDRKIMYARKMAIYLSREMVDLPYAEIAKQFGNRDHSTIMHSVKSIEKQMSESRETREELENIKRKIKEM